MIERPDSDTCSMRQVDADVSTQNGGGASPMLERRVSDGGSISDLRGVKA